MALPCRASTPGLPELYLRKRRRTCGLYPKRSVNHFHDWLPGPPASRMRLAADLARPAMPLHLERIDWMPSPPIAPDDGPIDLGHLKRMTLGDARLTREVLTMFVSQTARLVEALAAEPARGAELAHT